MDVNDLWKQLSTHRGQRRRVTDEQIVEILADPRTYKEIAKTYRVSDKTIFRIKNRTHNAFGLKSPTNPNVVYPNMALVTAPQAPRNARKKELDEEDLAKIKSDRRSDADLAEGMGLSRTTIWRVRTGRYEHQDPADRPDRIVARVGAKTLRESDLRG